MVFNSRNTWLGTVVNTATVTGYCSGNKKSAQTSTKTRVGRSAILLEMIDCQDLIPVGETVRYQIKITNQGTAPDRNIRVKTILPQEVTYVSTFGATPLTLPSGRPGETVTFQPRAQLDPGEEWVFWVTVKPKGLRKSVLKSTCVLGVLRL